MMQFMPIHICGSKEKFLSVHIKDRRKYGISSPNFPKIQMKAVVIYLYVFLILLILCKCTGTHIHMFNNGTSYYAMEFV